MNFIYFRCSNDVIIFCNYCSMRVVVIAVTAADE